MPSVLLMIAALVMGFASVRSRSRCLALVSAASLLLANPMEMLLSQRLSGGSGMIEWSLATAAPIAGSVLMVVAAFLALRPDRRRPQSAQRPGARASTAHVLLRLVTVLLFTSLVIAVISVAPSLLGALPEVLSYTGAAVMLLVVWALWPMFAGWEATQRNPA